MRGTEIVQSTEARSLGIVMRTKNPGSELFGISRLVYPNWQLLLDEFQHDFENVKVEKNSYDVAGHYTSWLYVSGRVRKEKKGKKYVETQYLDYQERYAVEPRRTDVRLIELIERECNSRPPDDSRQLKLLDLGCSSGNLLYHLRNRLPRLRYTGADVFPGIIEHCSQNPRLAGMDFHVLDVRKFDSFPSSFDFITVNAVLHRFDRATCSLRCGTSPTHLPRTASSISSSSVMSSSRTSSLTRGSQRTLRAPAFTSGRETNSMQF